MRGVVSLTVMEGAVLLSLSLALVIAAPTTVVPPPDPPPAPETPPSADFISEMGRAGIKRELFERPVKPQADLLALFSTDDYPIDAMRKSESGTVGVVLKVGADGSVTDCVVTGSSGSPSLDTQTCRIFWQRARFIPAKNSRGQPVESAVHQRIKWELPESGELAPIEPWSMRLTIEFVQNGGVVDCKIDGTGAFEVPKDQRECGLATDMWEGVLGSLRSDAGYERGKFVFGTQFAPGNQLLPADAPDGTRLLSRQVVRLTIDASGKTLQCRVVESEGFPAPDSCDDLLPQRYEKPSVQAGAIEATLIRSAFASEFLSPQQH